ncbi:unnamed protein product [Darwinula stevensoni]|uniref:Uncharacterized protein n=1 Tax=Darwinula stevensoni TaxID=69355 RepID=A0A7R9FS85_9CRUS|nr:unnamed protein product [Darwinula stevensoni]CAG0902128.1 unnamed protein product [Darwinula stevensoni]
MKKTHMSGESVKESVSNRAKADSFSPFIFKLDHRFSSLHSVIIGHSMPRWLRREAPKRERKFDVSKLPRMAPTRKCAFTYSPVNVMDGDRRAPPSLCATWSMCLHIYTRKLDVAPIKESELRLRIGRVDDASFPGAISFTVSTVETECAEYSGKNRPGRDARKERLLNRTLKTRLSSTESLKESQIWPEFLLTAEQCRNVTFVTGSSRTPGRTRRHRLLVRLGVRKDSRAQWHSQSLLPLFPHLSLRRANETGCQERN